MELNVVVQNNHRSLDRDALDSCDFYKLSPGRRAGSKPGGCCLASALKLKTTLLSGGATCADEGLDKMFGHQLKEAKTHNIDGVLQFPIHIGPKLLIRIQYKKSCRSILQIQFKLLAI